MWHSKKFFSTCSYNKCRRPSKQQNLLTVLCLLLTSCFTQKYNLAFSGADLTDRTKTYRNIYFPQVPTLRHSAFCVLCKFSNKPSLYGLDGLEIEIRWWGEVFRTRPDLPWGPLLLRVPDGFGGIVVSMLASGTQVCGFKPGRSRWIFTGVKIPSMPSSGGEVKESVPCPSFAACQRT